jgi:hypothetical protein
LGAAAVALLTTLSPAPAQQPDLCAMKQEQANHSPLCLRWYFSCQLRKPEPGARANLSYSERYTLRVGEVFKAAEQSCDNFNYQEALAAMRAKLMVFPPQ